MSVLVKGMEMPKGCFYCTFRQKVNPDEIFCWAMRENYEETFSETIDGRHKDCPLVEVSPHGRLIDADALEDSLGIEDIDIYAYHIINDAPTIIEAERGE